MKKRQWRMDAALLRTAVIFFCLACAPFPAGSAASANYFEDFYNGVEKFSGLPGEVNELKKSYEQTLDELDRAKQSAKAYEEQNAKLLEQNRELAQTVNQLKDESDSKDAKARKFKNMLIAVVLLVAGYFIGIRVLRFFMRRSNRKLRR
ncbi:MULTISPECIES: hypothetical protein [Paenibacillus]|uniref:Uncharacterized protein n=1 Tax=Paenibacillus albilobatus TaxID=2716884 RepID=A0A920CBW0_9BACL|nr:MULTISPECIES: hypothetical protein [Paenibacillus]GIO33865.1 hypothetical protein J2TS6_50060 [Paenibacillus albilobatus]